MTTGLAGGTEAAAAVAVGTMRAAHQGRSPGSAVNQDSSEHGMGSGCSAEARLPQVGGVALPPVGIAGGSSSFTG